jgi:rubrerythrin
MQKVSGEEMKQYKSVANRLLVQKKRECKECLGYGLWRWGDPSPMGSMDARDGCPTKPCPICGADYNKVSEK